MAESNFLHSSFYIQNVEIKGRVFLAPMDGYTDYPFRMLCRRFGSALNTSEFLNGIDVVHGHPHLKYHTFFTENERPFSYQVFDDDPQRLLQAAILLEQKQPDIIDVNMGCSARNVSNRGAGAGLLKNPQKIQEIMSLLTLHLKVPVTAKIRLGWDADSRNYLEVTQILQDNGASAITVHARTRKQEYSGSADWSAIAEIKNIAHVPIIGNGDVKSLTEALYLVEQTGCDAVMIGRAAIGNPWIFSGKNLSDIDGNELFSVISAHLSAMCSLYSPRIGTMLFRKHLAQYLKKYLPTPEIRMRIFAIEDPRELLHFISYQLNLQVEIQEDYGHTQTLV